MGGVDESRATSASGRDESWLWRRLDILARAEALVGLGSWEWDLCSDELHLTDEMYRLVGQAPGEKALHLRDLLRRVHPDDRRRVFNAIEAALLGDPLRADYRVRLPDGGMRLLHCEGEAIFDEAGRAVRLIGTAQDVTDSRRTIEQLEGGQRLFRLLVENARDVLFRFRVEPTIGFEYLSPSAGDYIGISREDLYANPARFFKRVHPADLPRVYAAIRDPEHNSPYQIRVRGKHGEWLWAEQVLVPIRDENGKLRAIEGISRDVTMRKEAEQEREHLLALIAEERSWLQTVIDRLPVAVVLVTRRQGRWRLSCNVAAEKLLGRRWIGRLGTPREVGRLRHIDGTPVPLRRDPTARALRGETIAPEEYRIRRADGSEVPVLTSAAPLRSPSGAITGVVSAWEDLTTVKALERLREEWTSLVAHDLLQPVTVIGAYGGLLARHLEEPQAKAKAIHIVDASKRLRRLIEDLLDVSRIESCRLSLELQPVDLVRRIEAAVEAANSELESPRIHVRIERAPHGPVLVDPIRLDQILGNLLSNAVKYGERGTPIEVALRCDAEAARIAVTNHGAPIPSEDLPHIFSRFRRSRSAEEGKVAGLGLGLYIARGLVEAHGGSIQAESLPSGNVFHFELPLQRPT